MILSDQMEMNKEEHTDMHRSKLFCVYIWTGTRELSYVFAFSWVCWGEPDAAHQCMQVPGEKGYSPGCMLPKVWVNISGLLLNSLRCQL